MYVVIEIQCSGEDNIATLVNTYADRNLAEQKYHMILQAAAVSQIDLHSAVLLSDTGHRIKGETYDHRVIPEPVEIESNEGEE